jgi:hypothetical protein
MATTGAANSYVLNITELQNVVTTASGLSPVAALSNTVAQIQQMVIFDEKRIAVNSISKFSQSPIQVLDSMNFASNAALTLNDIAVTASGSTTTTGYGSISSIGNAGNYTNYASTTLGTDTAISMQVGALTPFTIDAAGNTTITGGLTLAGTGTPGAGLYLTCMDGLGTAQWQTMATPSDERLKTDITPIHNYSAVLGAIRGVRFRWSNGGAQDIGVIAQDLMSVLPEAVIEGIEGRPHLVHYNKIIPVLVEAIKGLEQRVKELETERAFRL